MVSSVCHDQVVQSLKPFTIWEVIVNKNLCCDAWGINILKKDQVWETTYLVVDLNLTGTNLLKHMLPSLAFPFCKKNNLPKLYFDACRAVSQKTEKPRWKKCSRKKREKNRERKWVIAMSTLILWLAIGYRRTEHGQWNFLTLGAKRQNIIYLLLLLLLLLLL